MEEWMALLVEAGEALQSLWSALLGKGPLPYACWIAVLALHCCFCAPLLPELRQRSWSLHLAATLAWAFGGGTATALVAGDRLRAPLAVFAGNDVLGVWMPVWWLLNYAPGGVAPALRALLVRRPCAALARGSTALLRAGLIVGRVDLAVSALYPGSAAGALLLGTLAGASGRFLADAFRAASGLPPLGGRPPEISAPGFTTRSAFLASLAHLLMAHGVPGVPDEWAWLAQPWLPSRAASAGLVIGALVLQSVLGDLLARPLDFTAPLAALAHAATGVPVPAGEPGLGGGGAALAPAKAAAPRARRAPAPVAVASPAAAPAAATGATTTPRRRAGAAAAARRQAAEEEEAVVAASVRPRRTPARSRAAAAPA